LNSDRRHHAIVAMKSGEGEGRLPGVMVWAAPLL